MVECGEVTINKQFLISFTVGKYSDEVITYDVVLVHVKHSLLGRPWMYDRK